MEAGSATRLKALPCFMRGFENTGANLRFTSPAQLLGSRGARLISPDGTDRDVLLTGGQDEPAQSLNDAPVPDDSIYVPWDATYLPVVRDGAQTITAVRRTGGISFKRPLGSDREWKSRLRFIPYGSEERDACHLPFAGAPEQQAFVHSFNDTTAQVTIPLGQCSEVAPQELPRMYVALLAGRSYGLSDSPFYSAAARKLTFLISKASLVGHDRLQLRRLFLDNQYVADYRLVSPAVAYTGVTVAQSTKLGAVLALTGSRLTDAEFQFPWRRAVTCCDTFTLVSLTNRELSSVKQLVLAPKDESTPILIPIPSVSTPSNDTTDDASTRFPISLVQSDDNTSTYAIVSIPGNAESLAGATFVLPSSGAVTVIRRDDRNLWFSLKAVDAKAFKEVGIQLVDANGQPTKAIFRTLPAPPKDDTATTGKLSLRPIQRAASSRARPARTQSRGRTSIS